MVDMLPFLRRILEALGSIFGPEATRRERKCQKQTLLNLHLSTGLRAGRSGI